jgi:hypothetical protein
MSRPAVVGLSVALAASLAVNAWLLAGRRAPGATSSSTDTAAAADTAAATDAAAPAATAAVAAAPVEAPAPSGAEAACRRELADLRVKLWAHLPLPEKFAAGAPSPEAEARVRPAVEAALAGLSVDWSVECHGRVCHLQVVEASSADGDAGRPDDWMGALQAAGAVRALARGMSFTSPRPGTDPVSGKGTLVHDSWLELAADGADAQAGLELLQALWQQFLDGPHATCGKPCPPAPPSSSTCASM